MKIPHRNWATLWGWVASFRCLHSDLSWKCRRPPGSNWWWCGTLPDIMPHFVPPFPRLEPALCTLFGHRPSNFATFGAPLQWVENPMQMQGIPLLCRKPVFALRSVGPALSKSQGIAQIKCSRYKKQRLQSRLIFSDGWLLLCGGRDSLTPSHHKWWQPMTKCERWQESPMIKRSWLASRFLSKHRESVTKRLETSLRQIHKDKDKDTNTQRQTHKDKYIKTNCAAVLWKLHILSSSIIHSFLPAIEV